VASKKGNYAITYFIVAYGNESIGVAKKIEDQITAWTAKKLEILLFVVTDSDGAEVWSKLNVKSKILIEKKGILRFFSRPIFLYLAKRETQGILYIRETFPIPYKRIKKGPRWILEVQTIQQNELKLRSIYRLKLYGLLQKSWNSKFEGVVFVSNELSHLLKNSYEKSQSTVISNGINLKRFGEKTMISAEQDLQFLFIGSLDQEWQGTDQLIELAKVMPDVKFNLIGPTNYNLKASENVVFHGSLNTYQYSEIASKCRLAFGTLNQQVTGMNEASPLKVREYLALGLPVVIRYVDTDFPADHHFILKIPIDMRPLVEFKKEISDFSSRWADKRVSESEIAPFISVNSKEQDRLAFFDRILAGERR
jgi:glycosyltransferase involved in cell wall biosynthesis